MLNKCVGDHFFGAVHVVISSNEGIMKNKKYSNRWWSFARIAAFMALLGWIIGTQGVIAAEKITAAKGEDGMYTLPWALQSFLDLREDLKETAQAKKRLVVLWEQRGCIYCEEMHTKHLTHPAIHDYIRDNFNVIQLNLWGDREVTDFDGKVLKEKDLAVKWGVLFTPTAIFFPETPEDIKGKSGRDVEVARMPGLFKPATFLGMYRYVRENRYKTQHFQKYFAEVIEDLRKELGAAAGM